jgi:hypothetical protein
MNEPAVRGNLLETLAAARDREGRLLSRCDDEPPRSPGAWTIKDHVAHLSAWREHAVHSLDVIRAGDPLPPYDDIDSRNERIYAENRDRSAADVRAAAKASYQHLMDAVAACSEDQLWSPRPDGGRSVWRLVPGNGHAHLAQHLTYLDAERGDPVAAEDAAAWAHRLELSVSTDTESRASADYNLACFYARLGRDEDAIPLLETSFAQSPRLRSWAAEDSDLDPLRGHPQLQRLLG